MKPQICLLHNVTLLVVLKEEVLSDHYLDTKKDFGFVLEETTTLPTLVGSIIVIFP